jgi:hypothetical protein
MHAAFLTSYWFGTTHSFTMEQFYINPYKIGVRAHVWVRACMQEL